MFNYIQQVKHRSHAEKNRFVFVATTISFLLIVAVWVPVRIYQFRSVTAKQEEKEKNPMVAGEATASPEAVVPQKKDLPFLSGSTPVATTAPMVIMSPVFIPEPVNSEEPEIITTPEATPFASPDEFPTL